MRYGSLGLPRRVATSHIAWDAGARDVARALARRLACEHFEGRYSRLLVDLNRSATHPRVIPAIAFSRPVPGNTDLDSQEARQRIERYWHPYRSAVERAVRRRAVRGVCLHLAVHSFTPVVAGRERLCDVGLLFDPARKLERWLAEQLRESLRSAGLSVRFNYPYRGTSDGLTTALRAQLRPTRYAGIEIELNQRLLARARERKRLVGIVAKGIQMLRLQQSKRR